MKPHIASLLNAVILIVLGTWGYFGSKTPSATALIPIGTGVILLILNNGLKRENKIVSHIAVILTLLILIALVKPLTASMARSDGAAVARVIIMMLFTLIALIYFIRSFVQARKSRSK